MKTHRKQSFKWAALPAVLGLALLLNTGCSYLQPPTPDTRAWGRSSNYQQRQSLYDRWGTDTLLFPCPALEQQRNEDWLRNR